MVRPILRMLRYPSRGPEIKQALWARIVSEGMKRGCTEHLGPRRLSRSHTNPSQPSSAAHFLLWYHSMKIVPDEEALLCSGSLLAAPIKFRCLLEVRLVGARTAVGRRLAAGCAATACSAEQHMRLRLALRNNGLSRVCVIWPAHDSASDLQLWMQRAAPQPGTPASSDDG
ncbi:hypothetical protein L1887_59315 [Cichorium endivia]|nr:hypothetical protein L1887_59315 [Cichorium endivia]